MKRNQIVILGSLFLIFTIIFLVIIGKKKPSEKEMKEEQKIVYLPVRVVKNMEREMQIVSYGQVLPNAEIDVAFEVQGKLEQGKTYLKPGMSFEKGQILYRVNNEEAFYTLSSRKIQLANLIVGILPDIELDFPSEKKKWTSFLDAVQPNKLLPEIPSINSDKERLFLTSRNVLSEYYNIRSLEARMAKYTYFAPFSGTVLETFAEPGAIANPGSRIARIAKTNDFEIKVPITTDHLKDYQKQGKASFYTVDGEKVGTGTINRISDVINQTTQSVDVYYSIKPVENYKIYSGMYLNVSISQSASSESICVPRMAVTDNKVSILQKGEVIDVAVRVVGNKPDSLYISGLKNGEKVILEKVETDRKGKTFKGIIR